MAGDRVRDRTFQSREVVWNTFESLARDENVPIDDLVNEAMAAYARVRGYTTAAPSTPRPEPSPAPASPYAPASGSYGGYGGGSGGRMPSPQIKEMEHRDPLEETMDAGSMSPLDKSYSPARAPQEEDDDDLARTSTRAAYARRGGQLPAPSYQDRAAPESEDLRTSPRYAAVRQPAPATSPMPAALSRMPGMPGGQGGHAPPPPHRDLHSPSRPVPPAGPPPLPPRLMPPTTIPMPGAPPREAPTALSPGMSPMGHGQGHGHGQPQMQMSQGTRRLILTYQGRQNVVDKDRYLLGRSKTQADLRLDDPNVSRQHAVIERVGAAWYVVDLGSTNGVHVSGERVARRALQDGDVIVITSHEIRCSLR